MCACAGPANIRSHWPMRSRITPAALAGKAEKVGKVRKAGKLSAAQGIW